MRQVVLDTETTGLNFKEGHRVIEIGCVEMINRRLTGKNFHYYINPEREIEQGALAVHGINNDFLQDKPFFADIAKEFCDFIEGAEVILPNGNLIFNEMINWTLSDQNRRMDFRIGVAYGTDPEVVLSILRQVAWYGSPGIWKIAYVKGRSPLQR